MFSHVTPETKEGSMNWKHPSCPPTKKFETASSVAKIVTTGFQDNKRRALVDFFDRGDINC